MWPFDSNQKKLDEIKGICQMLAFSLQVAEKSRSVFYKNITRRLNELDAKLDKLLFRLGPGKIIVHVIGELNMSDKLSFVVYLPPKAAPDVVSRELRVEIGDTLQVLELDADTSEVLSLSGHQGASVTLSLVDIDDAGNRSEASVLQTELIDTIAPPKPGTLGVEIVAEDFNESASDE